MYNDKVILICEKQVFCCYINFQYIVVKVNKMSQTVSDNEAYTDVVELCALLQCLGFSVKSLDTSDGNISQDGGMRSVVINCQSSGLHVVLESPSLSCSCPTTSNQQNSGIWQVSGMSGGKQLDKILTALSFLAHGTYQRAVGQQSTTCLSQASVSRTLNEFLDAITQPSVVKKYIRFPQIREERNILKTRFNEKFKIDCIGCIDGTYVAMIRPTSNEDRYFCRKGYHARNIQLEFGCSLLASLPKSHRERLSKELHEMIRCIKQHNESDADIPKEAIENKSASMIELKTPEKRDFPIKNETPTRYRSLDTLTAHKREGEQPLPDPGPLQKGDFADASGDESKDRKQIMCRRQSTYTLASTPGSVRIRNKTSSPIQASQSTLLESLIAAEKAAEELHTKLTYVIKEFMEDGKHDSSISSLTLDVSKISLLKCPEASKAQFASSPNLSGIGIVKEDFTKSHLKRFESASTSNLAPKSGTSKEKITSRLRRISPNIFKGKKESPSVNINKAKAQDARSKLNSLFKPKIVTPVRTPRSNMEASPSFSSSKNKFSHIKSTIPRPSKKE